MEYILNKLPVKTTNNFKVNDLKIDLDIPEITGMKKFSISNNDSLDINQDIIEDKLVSKIGLEFSKYLNVDITIPKNIRINDSVILEYEFSNDDVLIDKINFNYEENSSCNFIIIYKSVDNNKHFHHLLSKITSNTNSRGSITYINLLNDINVYNNATNYLNNIYLGSNNNIIDMNYYLNNIGENSKNIMRVEGAINDNTKKVFRGTIDFIEGCKNSIGDENENCVLLSDNVISRSLPQMLCHEEDVVGSHGVSSGKVDEDKLFYIMTHGYSRKDAEKLIVMANFSKILSNISDNKIRDEIINIIEDRI